MNAGALDFVLDTRRLNVALSRAQCLTIIVASPRLADTAAGSLDQVRLFILC